MHVLAVLPLEFTRRRLRHALGATATVAFCERAGELCEAAERLVPAPGPDALIVDVRDAAGEATAPAVRRLRARLPWVVVILYCAPSADACRQIFSLARDGVDSLLLHNVDDAPAPFAATLQRVRMTSLWSHLSRTLGAECSRETLDILRHCLEQVETLPTVSTIARAMGVPRRTLVHRCRNQGAPPPARLIGWSRVIAAARWIESDALVVDEIARRLGFGSPTAMRRMLVRYAGLRFGDVRAQGLACVLERLRAELRSIRLERAVHVRTRSSAPLPTTTAPSPTPTLFAPVPPHDLGAHSTPDR